MTSYFAYGSNMAWAQLKERCPSVRFLCVAELIGFKLAFTRRSVKRKCGVADIIEHEDASVWGAVFELDEVDLLALDRFEGATLALPAYQRRTVQVSTTTGQALTALTYEVVNKSAEALKPSAEYLGLIVQGADTWGLPPEYRAALTRIETQ